MQRFKSLTRRITGLGLLGLSSSAFAELGLNMTRGVTETSRNVYDLHMLIFYICCVIGVVVFGAMFYSIYAHRKSRGAQAAHFHESTLAEILWTIAPIVILVGMAVPATTTLLAMDDLSDSEMSIKVTGIQWKWKYDYLDEGISFISSLDAESEKARQLDSGIDVTTIEHYLLNVDKPLVVPVNKKIRFLMTANDVIHAWWVPELGWKKDAIPGFVNEMWTLIEEPGTYRGQCAELCGKDHAFMPIVVVAKSEADYKTWVDEQKAAAEAAANSADREWTMAELMERGESVYKGSCASCHQANGQGIPGAFPALAGSPVAVGPIEKHIDVVVNGVPNTAMAGYGSLLSDTDIAAVVTYERNAFGNTAGDMVQPSAIKAGR